MDAEQQVGDGAGLRARGRGYKSSSAGRASVLLSESCALGGWDRGWGCEGCVLVGFYHTHTQGVSDPIRTKKAEAVWSSQALSANGTCPQSYLPLAKLVELPPAKARRKWYSRCQAIGSLKHLFIFQKINVSPISESYCPWGASGRYTSPRLTTGQRR